MYALRNGYNVKFIVDNKLFVGNRCFIVTLNSNKTVDYTLDFDAYNIQNIALYIFV